MAYIDRGVAIKTAVENYKCSNQFDVLEMIEAMEAIPAADVAEVVRCKDCKHYIAGKCNKICYIMDYYYQGGFEVKQPNDFCSYGERRDT